MSIFAEELKKMTIDELGEENERYATRYEEASRQLVAVGQMSDSDPVFKMQELIRVASAMEQIARDMGLIYFEVADRMRSLIEIPIRLLSEIPIT